MARKAGRRHECGWAERQNVSLSPQGQCHSEPWQHLGAELPQGLMLAVISTAGWEHSAFGQQSHGSPRGSEQWDRHSSQEGSQAAEQTNKRCIKCVGSAMCFLLCVPYHSHTQPKSSLLNRIPIYTACKSGDGRNLRRTGQNVTSRGRRGLIIF